MPSYSIIPPLNAAIAQLVEQTFRKRQVKSSNLFGGLINNLEGQISDLRG